MASISDAAPQTSGWEVTRRTFPAAAQEVSRYIGSVIEAPLWADVCR